MYRVNEIKRTYLIRNFQVHQFFCNVCRQNVVLDK